MDTDPTAAESILNLQPGGTDGPPLSPGPPPPPFAVHHEPEAVAQPMQEVINQLERARQDIGGLISRVDQLETTIRRVDRQTIMMAASLAIILWTVKSIAARLPAAAETVAGAVADAGV